MKYDCTIFIGRFQPFHSQHLELAKLALTQSNYLIIFVGSIQAAPDFKNPWSFEERKAMITASMDAAGLMGKYIVLGLRDYYYSDNEWVRQVQRLVKGCTSAGNKIALVGYKKDHSSYYLSLFPKWEFLEYTGQYKDVNATDIRSRLFNDGFVSTELCDSARNFLTHYMKSSEYFRLQEEWKETAEYQDRYTQAKKTFKIYDPTFVTVDAVVICGGHILLVRRNAHPGKGLLALPGGFIGQNEQIKDACLRELKEETRHKIPNPVMEGSIVAEKVFSHPNRSLRGRTITHAYYFQLNNEKELPKVRGGDDAAKAFWMELSEVEDHPREFFEDHAQIIEYFMKLGEKDKA